MAKALNAANLTLLTGNPNFKKEDFVKTVQPYFTDLTRVGRTNYLFAAIVPNQKPVVTGYATNTTINATINSRVIECEKNGGMWAVYSLS